MALYVIGGTLSLGIALLLMLMLRSTLEALGLMEQTQHRKSNAKPYDLTQAFVLVFDPKDPLQLEVRKVLYTKNHPSAIWDGKFRAPWGW